MIRMLGSLAAFALLGAGILGVQAAGTSAVPLPDNVVIFGSDAVRIGEDTNILSGDTASNKRARIGRAALLEGSILADRLTLQQDATIIGNAEANRIKNNGATIQGETITPRVTPDYELPDIAPFHPGRERIHIRKNETTTIQAGSYGAISLGRGANVTLEPGAYNIRRLHVGRGATLTITDTTILNISNDLFIGAGTIINLAQNLGTDDLLWNVRGHGATFVGKDVFGAGNITAPRGSIHIGKETTWRGRLIGKKVRVGKEAIMSAENRFEKPSDPNKIVEDEIGRVIVNELIVLLVEGTTSADALDVASAANGRLTGYIPNLDMAKVEVETTSVQELLDRIEQLENAGLPSVEVITPNGLVLD